MTESPMAVRDQPTDTEEKPMVVVVRIGNDGCGDPSGKRLEWWSLSVELILCHRELSIMIVD